MDRETLEAAINDVVTWEKEYLRVPVEGGLMELQLARLRLRTALDQIFAGIEYRGGLAPDTMGAQEPEDKED